MKERVLTTATRRPELVLKTATRMKMSDIERLVMLSRMIDNLNQTYRRCEDERDFGKVYALLTAFRDIIMVWPLNDFSMAYDELADWQHEYLEAFESSLCEVK